jgi:hypothetical protein
MDDNSLGPWGEDSANIIDYYNQNDILEIPK